MMTFKRLILFSTLFCTAISVWAGEEKDLAPDLGFAAGEVTHSTTAGHWQDAGKSGEFRIVITRTTSQPVSAKLFLQWLARDVKDGTTSVLYTVGVDEINRPAVYAFRAVSYRQVGADQFLQLLMENQFTHKVEQQLLALKPAGQYVLVSERTGKEILGSDVPVDRVAVKNSNAVITSGKAGVPPVSTAAPTKKEWTVLLSFPTF